MSFFGLDNLPFVQLRKRDDNTFTLKLRRNFIFEEYRGIYKL